ncbi:MAG: hypothetical protein JXK05_11095 [Campylobacterales bacterium]|nr:hypothetical protein [Campylobacterales bacterium]
MSGILKNQSTLTLEGSKNGIISIAQIEEPYGPNSATVASIGISLSGDAENPEWKVHIPMKNLPAVVSALQSMLK